MKIITVTLSPAYDIHCSTPSLELGAENTASITSFDAGGKGVNLSRALFAMGRESAAIVALGKENSCAFLGSMTEPGIAYKPITVSGRIRENITVHTPTGETRLSFKPLPYERGLLEKAEAEILGLIEKGSTVVFAGKLPEGIKESGFAASLLRIKEKGARIVIDSGSVTVRDVAEIKPYLIKPNLAELSALVGRELDTAERIKAAAAEVAALGAENVLLSMGADGAMLFGSLGEHFIAAPRIEAVSTVGAGDSLLAGFLFAESKGLGIAESLRWAVAAGSAACLREGTAPPELAVMKKIIEDMQ